MLFGAVYIPLDSSYYSSIHLLDDSEEDIINISANDVYKVSNLVTLCTFL